MDVTTPDRSRAELAAKHLQAHARSGERSLRQLARLRMLQWQARRLPRPAAMHSEPARRLLVIRPDHLGDVLFATPALHFLRGQFPQAHITALVGPWGEPVLAGTSDVDEVLTLSFPGFTRQPKASPLAPYALLRTEAQRLAAGQFDLALVLRFDHWWGAWLAAVAGIPRRIGYDVDEVRPFVTEATAYVRGRHEVVQNLALALVAAGVAPKAFLPEMPQAEDGWPLRLAVSAADAATADQLLAALPGDRRLVAIHPGSGAAVKRWRGEAWAELVRRLSVDQGVQVVFTGSAGEAELIDQVLHALAGDALPVSPVSLAGRTSLGVLAAVYRRSALAIGPDSGPLHVAVAVGTPTVHFYGPVDRRTFGPWGSPRRHRVVTSDWACIPCNRLDWRDGELSEHGCVRDVTVAQVLAESVELLNAGGWAIQDTQV